MKFSTLLVALGAGSLVAAAPIATAVPKASDVDAIQAIADRVADLTAQYASDMQDKQSPERPAVMRRGWKETLADNLAQTLITAPIDALIKPKLEEWAKPKPKEDSSEDAEATTVVEKRDGRSAVTERGFFDDLAQTLFTNAIGALINPPLEKWAKPKPEEDSSSEDAEATTVEKRDDEDDDEPGAFAWLHEEDEIYDTEEDYSNKDYEIEEDRLADELDKKKADEWVYVKPEPKEWHVKCNGIYDFWDTLCHIIPGP